MLADGEVKVCASDFEFRKDCQHSRVVQVHPGLTSWGIFSRPYGTGLDGNVYPGLTSWAILSRPCGTDRDLLVADLLLANAVQISRSKKANLAKIA